MTTYPLTPKTNAHLSPGQSWSIPLADGRFGCGRVLRVDVADRRAPIGLVSGSQKMLFQRDLLHHAFLDRFPASRS